MKRNLDELASRTYDLLIIGGGITGAATAHDAALRGLSVAMVERRDFGGATSAATSKLVHGGLRYLRTLEFGLVRESLRERRYMESIAPHLVAPLPFLIPAYWTRNSNLPALVAAMSLYDRLSYDKADLDDIDRRVPGWELLTKREALIREAGLDTKGLHGGVVYHDCQMVSPDRLTWEFVEAAIENGAQVANYAEAVSLLVDERHVHGAVVKDAFTGKEYEVRASMTINAAGPWADYVTKMLGDGHDKHLVRSQGIHLVTRQISRMHAIVLTSKRNGRLFFVIPWRGHSLIGTTDNRFEGPPDEYRVTQERVEDFIAEVNEALPSANLSLDDVLWTYGGLRPIVETDTAVKDVNKASRKYEIYDHKNEDRMDGLITVIGGKYTTSRALAQQLTEMVCRHLNLPRPARVSHRYLLPGGRIGSWAGFQTRLMREFGLYADDAAILCAHYGARVPALMQAAKNDKAAGQRIREDLPDPMAVVDMAVNDEMAQTLDDVLYRRTGAGTLGEMPEESVRAVAKRMAPLAGWDKKRTESEVAGALAKTRSRGFVR